MGFELLKEEKENGNDKDRRTKIIKTWLSQESYAVNIYFPNIADNPEEYRGKVLWFDAMKTCFDQWYAAINRDDAGKDKTDPEAYGVFYDPEHAYLYKLEISKQGENNSYKTSKFLANIGAHPMARLKDGKPDLAKIELILSQRHDLFTKVEEPSPSKLRLVYNKMVGNTENVVEESENTIPAELPTTASAEAEDTMPTELEENVDLEVPVEEPPAAPAPKPAVKAPAKPATAAPAPKAPPKPAAPAKPAPQAAKAPPQPAPKAPPKPAPKPAPAPEPTPEVDELPGSGDDDLDKLLGELDVPTEE